MKTKKPFGKGILVKILMALLCLFFLALLLLHAPLAEVFSAHFDRAKMEFALEMATLNTGFLIVIAGIGWMASKLARFRNADSETRFFSILLVLFLAACVSILAFSDLSLRFSYLEKTRGIKWHDYALVPLRLEKDILVELTNSLHVSEVDYKKIRIPVYEMFVRDAHLSELNSNLPFSGIESVPSHIQVNNVVYETKSRYRGDNYYHWGAVKKSWRISLRNDQLLSGMNKFNLINSKYDSQMVFPVTSQILSEAGILTPRSFNAALFINNKYAGVYEYVDQLDESFLRMNNLLPGDIYAGDKPRDEEEWITPEQQEWIVFDDANRWEIQTTFDQDEGRARENIAFFLENANSPDPQRFYQFFEEHLGEEYLNFLAEKTAIYDIHVDDRHNHRFYFDPSSGFFVPLGWDQQIEPIDRHSTPDMISNRLDRQIVRFPQLVGRKNQLLYSQITQFNENNVIDFIEENAAKIEYPLSYDVYKHVAEWPLSKNITLEDWQKGVESLKENIQTNYAYIQNQLSQTDARLTVLDSGLLVLDINGVSGVRIVSPGNQCLSVQKHGLLEKGFCLGQTKTENEFFPGREIWTEKVRLGRLESDVLRVAPTNIRYVFDSNSQDLPKEVQQLRFYNSSTGKEIFPEIIRAAQEPNVENYLEPVFSEHPWNYPQPELRQIEWSGEMVLNQDLVFGEQDTLVILPGTTIRLEKGVSIFSFGKIIARGTQEKPIVITSAEKGAWGTIALQGKQASLEMDWVNVSNGSGGHYGLVDYSGTISVYNAQYAKISNSSFSNTTLVDDTLNFKRTPTWIEKSVFSDSLGDLIDFDLAPQAEIISSSFYNSGGDSIDLMTTNAFLKDITIVNAGDKGISIGEKSDPKLNDVNIMDSNIGIAIKDKSNPTIRNLAIQSSKAGAVEAYPKNWRYGGGGLGTISNFDICNNQTVLSIVPDSNVMFMVHGKKVYCTDSSCDIGCSS